MEKQTEEYKFFTNLREYIIKFEDKKKLAPYYEALLQIVNDNGVLELLELCENNSFEVNYTEEDKEDYYSNGTIEVWFDDFNIKQSYTINLGIHDDSSGYCECRPDMNGYNPEKDCCGVGCDTTFPSVHIVKQEDILSHTYSGYAKDLWNDLEKWNDEYDKEIKEKERLQKVETIKSRMAQLQMELNSLEN